MEREAWRCELSQIVVSWQYSKKCFNTAIDIIVILCQCKALKIIQKKYWKSYCPIFLAVLLDMDLHCLQMIIILLPVLLVVLTNIVRYCWLLFNTAVNLKILLSMLQHRCYSYCCHNLSVLLMVSSKMVYHTGFFVIFFEILLSILQIFQPCNFIVPSCHEYIISSWPSSKEPLPCVPWQQLLPCLLGRVCPFDAADLIFRLQSRPLQFLLPFPVGKCGACSYASIISLLQALFGDGDPVIGLGTQMDT